MWRETFSFAALKVRVVHLCSAVVNRKFPFL